MMRIAIAVGCLLVATSADADDTCTPDQNGLYRSFAEAARCEQRTDAAKLAPFYRWRWEVAVGGSLGALRLRERDLEPAGLMLQLGARTHRLAIVGDYRALGVTWHADPTTGRSRGPSWMATDTRGTLQRFGVAARYSLLTLGLDSIDKDLRFAHEFFELFVEAARASNA